MPQSNPSSLLPATNGPRHPHEEIADLLAAALLRLRDVSDLRASSDLEPVRLDLSGTPRVTTNSYENKGV